MTAIATRGAAGPEAAAAWRQPPGVRRRTVEWDDPMHLVMAALERTGLETMQEVSDGTLPPPPIALLLGFGPSELEHGRTVFTAEPGEHLYNPMATIHGGVITTWLDTAMGCAVYTTLPAGSAYTTLDLQVRFVRPITLATGPVSIVGEVVHRGGRVATAEGRVIDGEGRLLAHATTSCMIWEVPA
jgi:uncharacterized protein (TIGR00369 family)